jgi:hypothetical protein
MTAGPEGGTSDGLVAHVNAALRQQFLDVTEAECEAEIEPHGVPNEVRLEAVTLELDRTHAGLATVGSQAARSGEFVALD